MMSFQSSLYKCPFCDEIDDSDNDIIRHIIRNHCGPEMIKEVSSLCADLRREE